MKKPSVIAMLALLVCGGLVIFFVWRHNAAPSSLIVTEKDMAEAVKNLGRGAPPPQMAAVPLDLKRPVRLAIGSLGFADENQNRRISDLVLAELSGAPSLNLVERQALDTALREMSMSLSGLVRAKDAVRVGKLLKADWFLLGTEAKFGGTNFVVVRVVDARTGILRDAGVFSGDKPPTQLSTDIAAFVRKSRQMAATAKPRIYLAIGTFQDLSVNNRQAAFPAQLRSFLTAAYQGTEITLLEREAVDTLLQEVRLDLAGLTENGGTNAPQPMQSAYWLVDGSYQSYETTNFQVELVLEITRMFGRREQQSFRGEPAVSLFQQVKSAIDSQMINNATALWPTRNSEAHVQMLNGKELARLGGVEPEYNLPSLYTPEAARHNAMEALRAFETVLLLEPTNREAKLYVATCMERLPKLRIQEAREYYREILEEPIRDKWTRYAELGLGESLRKVSAEEGARWFKAALRQTTNSLAASFYEGHAQASADEVTIASADATEAEQLAQKRLFEAIRSGYTSLTQSGLNDSRLGMQDYLKVIGTNNEAVADQLVGLLPKMKAQAPRMEPYLLATVITFQTKPNAPVVDQFRRSLDECVEHPESVFKIEHYWHHVGIVYDWCFKRTNYDLAVKIMEGKERAKREGIVDDFHRDDMDKLDLAYAYLAAEQWQKALAVFQSFSNRTVEVTAKVPWAKYSQLVFTDQMVNCCNEKLGIKMEPDNRGLDMGPNLVPMHTVSAFAADTDGVWLAIAGELIRLDFDLKTNLTVELPVSGSVPISCICVGPEKLWIGTAGEGLVEFDKATHQCRLLTQTDGLMMNSIASMHFADGRLWIGYAGIRRASGVRGDGSLWTDNQGGLGMLDLRSKKFVSFMNNLDEMQANKAVPSPKSAIESLFADSSGDLWVAAAVEGLRCLHIEKSSWEVPQDRGGGGTTAMAVDDQHLVEGVRFLQKQFKVDLITKTDGAWPTNLTATNLTTLVLSMEEVTRLESSLKTNHNRRIYQQREQNLLSKGALHIYSFRSKRWQSFEDYAGTPCPPTALALDGHQTWVGGKGYISLIDLDQSKVLRWCHIQTSSVDRIQIAGGYVWAQFDWHLHRALLTDLR